MDFLGQAVYQVTHSNTKQLCFKRELSFNPKKAEMAKVRHIEYLLFPRKWHVFYNKLNDELHVS